MHSTRRVLFAIPFILASAGVALAHAHLKKAEPPINSVVTTAPVEVVIYFTESVEPKFSSIEVQNAHGQRVDKGETRTAPGDATRLIASLTTLTPGTYKVMWHATSVDTHKTEGTYRFTVAQ